MADQRHSVAVTELLRDTRDKQVSFRWPMAVDQRLDALVARADEAGERTNRRELIAALIADADRTGEQLGELLRRYRRSRVGEVVLDADLRDNLVVLASYKPGPRTAAE
jgi:hypothetical protein